MSGLLLALSCHLWLQCLAHMDNSAGSKTATKVGPRVEQPLP